MCFIKSTGFRCIFAGLFVFRFLLWQLAEQVSPGNGTRRCGFNRFVPQSSSTLSTPSFEMCICFKERKKCNLSVVCGVTKPSPIKGYTIPLLTVVCLIPFLTFMLFIQPSIHGPTDQYLEL